MSLWDQRMYDESKKIAQEFIEQLTDDASALLWDAESGRTPSGMTLMDDAEEQMFLEEMTILGMKGGQAGQAGRDVVEHPLADARIAELEAKARGEVASEDEFLDANGRGL